MKNLIIAAALFGALVITGCDASSPVDNGPVHHAESISGVESFAEGTSSGTVPGNGGTIVLNGRISLGPITGSGTGQVPAGILAGQARFSLAPSSGQASGFVSVALSLSASLTRLNDTDPIWYFAEDSEEEVYIPNVADPTPTPVQPQAVALVKSYRANGSGMATDKRLFVKFMITRESVSVDSFWLDDHSAGQVPPRS